MNFGEPGRGRQGDWTLGIDDARPILKAAIAHGLFYFDCANVHGLGACERVLGQLLRELLLNKPEIQAPVVGVSRIEQLDQLVDAAEITLADADVKYLEELYRPTQNLLSIGYS